MGGRERRRSERRKRKQRSSRHPDHGDAGGDRPPADQNGGAPPRIEDLTAGGELSRSELKNQVARDALEPLPEGERPLVVTLGAIASTVLFTAAVAGWLLWDALRDDTRPAVIAVLLFAAVVGVMAWGMWRVRYWAVLGFQAVLLFSILGSALGIVRATTVIEAVGNAVVLAAAGTLFYFMVKALARIQMPERGRRY